MNPIYCTACRQQLPNTAAYCFRCGTLVHPVGVQPQLRSQGTTQAPPHSQQAQAFQSPANPVWTGVKEWTHLDTYMVGVTLLLNAAGVALVDAWLRSGIERYHGVATNAERSQVFANLALAIVVAFTVGFWMFGNIIRLFGDCINRRKSPRVRLW